MVGTRAQLLSPGHPLLRARIATVLDRYGTTLGQGTTLIDPTDAGDTPRVLIYLQHAITDGKTLNRDDVGSSNVTLRQTGGDPAARETSPSPPGAAGQGTPKRPMAGPPWEASVILSGQILVAL